MYIHDISVQYIYMVLLTIVTSVDHIASLLPQVIGSK